MSYLPWSGDNRISIVKPSLVLWRFICSSRPSPLFSPQCCIPKTSSESDRIREVDIARSHLLRKLERLPKPDDPLLSNDCEPGSVLYYDVRYLTLFPPSPRVNLSNLAWTYCPLEELCLHPSHFRYLNRSNSFAVLPDVNRYPTDYRNSDERL